MTKKPVASLVQPGGSPSLSYEESLEESLTDSAGNSTLHHNDLGSSRLSRSLKTSSFETDLSSPRRARNVDQTKAYKSDPKYHKYVQLVERNLQSFDYVSEWADVTAFLTKLGRSFEIYAKFPVIPHKETVAKRLAQCLSPALPTGVHQKALSIYEQVFRQIGNEQLVADLPLYAYGLFPFMRNASHKAKPQLVDIFDEFFVPLGSSLRACMKSFVVGVLPGLEEGSMDVFNRVIKLLDALRETVDASFFFQTVFLIMITNSEQRESALKYLSQRLPVFTHAEDVVQVCGNDSSLMARALASTLTDSKTLVLRAGLDLLMTRFPLRTNTFSDKDLLLLMKHAAEVVLKKDMSLNRRLYTWLLGPGDSDDEQAAYFREHAQKHLAQALLGSFAAMSSDPDHQHTVLRVLIGLLDKSVISQPILDIIFVPLLQMLIAERDSRPEHVLSVKLASVSRMFVEMLDPIFTWSSIINQLTDTVSTDGADSLDIDKLTQALRLVLFFVQTFELDDDATLQVHTPMAMLATLATLDHVLEKHHEQRDLVQIGCCFTRIAIELFTRIPKSVYIEEIDDPAATAEAPDIGSLFEVTRSFYNMHREEGESSKSHAAAEVERDAAQVVRGAGLLCAINRLSKSIAAHLSIHIIYDSRTPQSHRRLASAALEDVCHVMRTVSVYAADLLDAPNLVTCDSMLPNLVDLLDTSDVKTAVALVREDGYQDMWVPLFITLVSCTNEFAALSVALSTLLAFVERGMLARKVLVDDNNLTKFVERLWASLSSENLNDHFQTTLLLYQLRSKIDAPGVERYLAGKLACGSYIQTDKCGEYAKELARYSVFWRNLRVIQRDSVRWSNDAASRDTLAFSRLLLLVLDYAAPLDSTSMTSDPGLNETLSSALARHMESRAWIDSSVDEWEYIVETLTTLLLLSVRTHKREYQITLAVGFASQRKEYIADFDYSRINYYMDTIQRYLACAGDSVVRLMVSAIPRSAAILESSESFAPKGGCWLQTLLLIIAEFALTDAPIGSDASSVAVQTIEQTRAKAADLAAYLVSNPSVVWPAAYIADIQERVIGSLLYSVLYNKPSMQPPLLDLFTQLVMAKVHSDGDLAAIVAKPDHYKDPAKPAGISGIPTLSIFSRLVLAAFTMQIDMVALSKWVRAITVCLPFIQEHISATPIGSSEDQDLMQSLVLPCIHTLRLLLSQCSEYFAWTNELSVTRNSLLTRRQLHKRLLPLFAIPATDTPQPHGSKDDEGQKETMSIDVLTVLLDTFDLFLSLCLRNMDKIPATSMVMQRPSSRASDAGSTISNASLSASSALTSIPVLGFVAGIFGQEDSEGNNSGEESQQAAAKASSEAKATQSASTSDAISGVATEFNLVSILAVLRDVWDAFDLRRSSSSPSQKPRTMSNTSQTDNGQRDLAALLGEFGVSESRSDDDANNSSGHVKQTVHSHISQILGHAVSAQQAEITEAIAALWICDNPHWITDLRSGPRSGVGQGNRRRRSSASSMQSLSITSPISSRDLKTPFVAESSSERDVEWDWRAVDLLEKVPGRSPVSILTTLLNSLHIRSVNPEAGASLSSALSSSSAAAPSSAEFGGGGARTTSLALLDDVALTRFIELYSRHHLTARSSSSLIPHIMSMLKEYNSNAQQNKLVLPFLLRMFTELCERVASNSQSQDPAHRVYSHELCNLFARMVDNCILIAGHSFDQSTWLRRQNNSDLSGVNGLVIRSNASLMMGGGKDDRQPEEPLKVLSEDDIIDQVLSYIGSCVIPQFSLLIPDYERQVGISTNLMHYAVTPALKSHMTGGYSGPAQALTSRSQHFALVLHCLDALSQQASLMKVWKREVWEFFSDLKFFPSSMAEHTTMSPGLAVPYWKQLIRTLLASEKEKFTEVLGKISSSSSGPALFANLEYEAMVRAIAIRRLSFVIWAGTTNQYLSSLPPIQERLVDILKSSPHPAVQIEVFMCLRVLLCRLSNHHMSNFWPMLLTELIRLCLLQLNREERGNMEQANLFLAACKFIDLLLILGTDDFLVHQWIFITDTIDALYASRSTSTALLDQLSSRLLSMPHFSLSHTVARRGSGSKSQQQQLLQQNQHGGTRHSSSLANRLNNSSYPKELFTDTDDPTNLVYQQVSATGLAVAKPMGLDSDDLHTLGGHPLKRPILRVRSVTSIKDLDAFVHNASVQAYQAAYTMAEPDVEFIEALLLSDLMYFDFGDADAAASVVPAGTAGDFEH
ncbi:hypothetical protein IW140_003231 [Coemansia sp. RSA 1813]|nr:hypothetical protein EV178_002484 [Coemansia sp. RSA 1646]KAJ1771417.1 hypothetical protein LPJ74_002350 [Coemansia sp. RSA 1843]KAJ2213763.1 hypothetical protein EV179_003562 [Coemansia sp. RSA 487]KAJ2569256.1 hypothetical protein IW140_003231 [Coemansia sp. RSA 1813]